MKNKRFSLIGSILALGLIGLALAGCSATSPISQAVDDLAGSQPQTASGGALQAQGQVERPVANANSAGVVPQGQFQRPAGNPDGANLAPQGSASSGGAFANPQNTGNGGGRGNGQMRGNQSAAGTGQALGPLSEVETEALLRAIEEELGAQALYQSVIDTFGAVYPFDGIAVSEGQHADALLRLAEKYGVTVPEYTPGVLPVYESIEQACQAGVTAEIADAALYDELMPSVTHTDILRVFENLKRASLENHLPSFETCQ